MASLVEGCLADPAWTGALDAFLAPLLEPARAGALAQVALKLLIPGSPDIYQGNELWDHSLVDPDNRRPVDFDQRRRLLAELDGGLGVEAILGRSDEGLPKLHLTSAALALRARRPAVFRDGTGYRPLPASGGGASRLLAFSLADDVVCVAQRRPVAVARDGWGETTLELPEGTWQDLLTAEVRAGGRVAVEALLGRFPVALLERTA
jgi:(1->4)-alpha-D-glucan 1-alpha-D-glucosylmutase